MRKLLLVALGILLVAGGASAAQIRDFYVLPVAAHTPGANGTVWRTDVSIQNIQNTPLNVQMTVIEAGEGATNNVQPLTLNGASSINIPANGNTTITDVLAGLGLTQVSGAILVGGDKPFAVTSRTYNLTSNGTLGQTVAPASDAASEGDAANSTLFIPGIVSNSAFRTNVGLLMSNGGSDPLTVTVSFNGPSGNALGSRTFTVAAGGNTQVQFPVSGVAGNLPFDSAGATVRITGGSGTVVGYASIVDDKSEDASYVSAGSASVGSVNPLAKLLLRQ